MLAPTDALKIAWVTRSFLDYRIPVYRALDELAGGGLHLIYSGDYVPQSVQDKALMVLGDRALGLRGEWKIGLEDRAFMANRNFSIRFQPGLLKIIRHLQPDVLVCDGFFKWTFPALLHRIRHGTPLVVLYERTAHTERRAQWIRTAYRRFALRYTDAMSCNGRLCREYSMSLGFPRERITLGQMAADTEGMAQSAGRVPESEIRRLRQKWGAEEGGQRTGGGRLVILYVGQLNKRKGIAEMLNGWEVFQRTEDGQRRTENGGRRAEDGGRQTETSTCRLPLPASARATLVIVGEGPERESLEQSAGRRELSVQFVGAVDYDKLAPYYAAADAFIIPTLEDNWSLVVPEAMACGLPILCSKYNGCWPELVQEGRNGWLFDPLDWRDIARVLEACLRASMTPTAAISAFSFPLSASAERVLSSVLRTMGQESRKVLRDHTPPTAADSIYRACEIALQATINS